MRASREEFEQIIADYIKELEINPCSDSVSDAEPFPANTAEHQEKFMAVVNEIREMRSVSKQAENPEP